MTREKIKAFSHRMDVRDLVSFYDFNSCHQINVEIQPLLIIRSRRIYYSTPKEASHQLNCTSQQPDKWELFCALFYIVFLFFVLVAAQIGPKDFVLSGQNKCARD
jgi:hypothetical protein